MKTVMLYEVAPDGLSKAHLHYAAHRARLDEFHARGVLLLAGPFGNKAEGAMGVFTDRAAAEQFIQGDPFVLHGIVAKWSLREWNEVLVLASSVMTSERAKGRSVEPTARKRWPKA